MIKDLLLQKGWAGKTISREETIERFNPLIRQHIILNRYYDAAIRDIDNEDVRATFANQLRTARADVGKLSETVFSCGGVAYLGNDIDPDTISAGSSRDEIYFTLFDMEQKLLDAITGEESVEHQMRSRAILGVVHSHSAERLNFLEDATRKLHRPR